MAIRIAESLPAECYSALFNRFVLRGVEAAQERISARESLPSEDREQAWHMLGYALQLPSAWTTARKLLLTLAPKMERDGIRQEWTPFLETGVECSRRHQDWATEVQLALFLGRAYRLLGELDKARDWFDASVERCRAQEDERGLAMMLGQRAYVARLQGRYADAEADVNEALSLFAEDDAERATCYFVLGTIAQDRGEWAQAEQHHRATYRIWARAGDDQRAAWSLQNLGDTLRGAGRYDEAAQTLSEAIVLLGNLGDSANRAIARMNLGILYLMQENWDKALALCALAETVFRQIDDKLHLAMVLNNMAIAYRMLEKWDSAERSAAMSVRLWELVGNSAALANTLDELGLAYQGQTRYMEATAAFKRGLALVEDLQPGSMHDGLHKMLADHLEELAQIVRNQSARNEQLAAATPARR